MNLEQWRRFYEYVQRCESMDRFTYVDYLTWDDSVRYELVYGVPYMMSAPSPWHQGMVLDLGSQLKEWFKD